MNEQANSKQLRTDPDGWISLRRAFRLFGSAVIGPDFVGMARLTEEAIAKKSNPPILEVQPNDAGDYVLNLDFEALTELFIGALCRSFRRAVLSGKLPTAYAKKGAGEVLPMPLGAWRTDDDYIRFDGWSFDPENFANAGPDSPCWVFVDPHRLVELMHELKAWRRGLPEWDGKSEPISEKTYCNRWPMEFDGVAFEAAYPSLWVMPPELPQFTFLSSVKETAQAGGSDTDYPTPCEVVSTQDEKELPDNQGLRDFGADDRDMTGDPGRPAKGRTLYLAEFYRRIASGEVEAKVSEEAKCLHTWFTNKYPNREPSTVGTIENTIRNEHRRRPQK